MGFLGGGFGPWGDLKFNLVLVVQVFSDEKLSETNSSPLKIGRAPIGNSSEPSIDFQGPPNSLLVFEGGYLMT